MKLSDKNIPAILLSTLLILFLVLTFVSQGTYGGGDTFTHYWISRYAFKYPDLLLNHWGKPIFTLLSAPFAQFGYDGITIFNILCGIGSAYFAYLVAKRLNYDYPWLVIPMVLFAPIYSVNMLTGLTEVLFGFILVLSVFLFIDKKFILSAVLISFIPIVRNEGAAYLLYFIPAYLIFKQYRAVPFLASGLLLYSIIGYFYYDTFFWLYSEVPYGEFGSLLYGSGSFWYYFVNFNEIIGIPLAIILLIGSAFMISRAIFLGKLIRENRLFIEAYLVFGSFLLFLVMHSFLWWQGLFGVLGSTRFMVCIVPLGAVIALKGLNVITRGINGFNKYKVPILVMVVILIAMQPFIIYDLPVRKSRTDAVLEKAVEWVKRSGYSDRFIYYYDPVVPYFMGMDPYDTLKSAVFLKEVDISRNWVRPDALVIWDAHYGPNEGDAPLYLLMDNPYFRLHNVFIPLEQFRTMGGSNYKVCIFEFAGKPQRKMLDTLYYLDFEDQMEAGISPYLKDTLSHRGKYSYHITQNTEFSPGYSGSIDWIPDQHKVWLKASVYVMPLDQKYQNHFSLVMSLENASGMLQYCSRDLLELELNTGQWNKVENNMVLDRSFYNEGILKVYLWNRNHEEMLFDDLSVEIIWKGSDR